MVIATLAAMTEYYDKAVVDEVNEYLNQVSNVVGPLTKWCQIIDVLQKENIANNNN